MEVGQRVGDEKKPGPKCRKAAPEDGLSFTDCKLGSGLDPDISFGLPDELLVAWLAAEGFCHAVGTAAPEAAARAAVRDFETLWSKLFPAEQARIIQLLVQRVTVATSGLEVDLRKEGIAGVIREIITPPRLEAAE